MDLESELYEQFDRDGFALIRKVYTEAELRETIAQLSATLESMPEGSASIRSRQGRVYAARNFLEVFPHAARIWHRTSLRDFLRNTLGQQCGLVRGLFFDKPPDQSWSLPWHKDLTIAVKNNALQSRQFRNPTFKAGVPHVEAPRSVLSGMLTLRIHLDDATPENGPLLVVPGSHNCEETKDVHEATAVLADAGDVLAMRPLLSHCSGNSEPGTVRHRRVIHLEFAADRELPDGFQWHYFQPIAESANSESAHTIANANAPD